MTKFLTWSLFVFSLSTITFGQALRVSAELGPFEIIVENGCPTILNQAIHHEDHFPTKVERQIARDFREHFNAKDQLTLKHSGWIFKKDELFFKGTPIATDGQRIGLIINAYYFHDGILATTQPHGKHRNDGQVDLMFIDLSSNTARFRPFGFKVMGDLTLINLDAKNQPSNKSINPQP